MVTNKELLKNAFVSVGYEVVEKDDDSQNIFLEKRTKDCRSDVTLFDNFMSSNCGIVRTTLYYEDITSVVCNKYGMELQIADTIARIKFV